MFHVKICGVTRADQVAAIRAAGADAIGLNFYADSPRCVSTESAGKITAACGDLLKVGVFVNHSAASIRERFDALPLDLIQLHGDEPPQLLAELGDRPVMKAFRFGRDGMAPVVKFLETCRVLHSMPRLILLDAHVPGEYGGSGAVADWDRIAADRSELGELPLILAGGLTGDNVAAAIAAVQPTGVDTASGVESLPGVKDVGKLQSFCSAARQALQLLG
ncbi:MAG: phosphoribosylanthranilate isomerase [Pirellulales bacterium]